MRFLYPNRIHRNMLIPVLIVLILLTSPITRLNPHAQAAGNIYLPMVLTVGSASQPQNTRINAPYFSDGIIWAETAISWFGRVEPGVNYADIRVGYNDQQILVQLEVFDRLLWYDTQPSPTDLTDWDAATLFLDTRGNQSRGIDENAYRFEAQLNWWEPRTGYQAAYQGSSSGWQPAEISFEAKSGWRGNAPNDTIEDRGWVISFYIPFSSLGFAAKPSDGDTWGAAIILHDRDGASGPPIPDQYWPAEFIPTNPSTWNQIRFGLPVYTPPQARDQQTTTIRDKLNGQIVVDAAVGGTIGNLCPGDPYFIWNLWGEANFAGAADFNIQNQGDVSDWPCFARYYVTFPLESIPAGKVILSAKMTLHQFGNSEPSAAQPSLIQVLTIAQGWDEGGITWNNAPLALENVSQAWVDPLTVWPDWPGVEREWDVSRAVAEAYQKGAPLRLSLYEADTAQHSGKHFVSSDTGDWNAVARPTLVVTYGDP